MTESVTIEIEVLFRAYCLLSDVGEALDDKVFREVAQKLEDAMESHHRAQELVP